MSSPELIEDFYGVYLLYNINPKYKGRTYIGYTRDPSRRIMQHNRGTWAGGAFRTSNKGPWKMVMIVYGFPNNISALRFEWAWQNPSKTIRLQHLNLKKLPRKESEYKFKLRVLSEMLQVGPWRRLPLSVRWLEEDFIEELPEETQLPQHMAVRRGPIKSKNINKFVTETSSGPSSVECPLCSRSITDKVVKVSCLNSACGLVSHITCLADALAEPGEYVPVGGKCPFCSQEFKWGDLIRKSKGCSSGKRSNREDSPDNEFDLDEDELSQKGFVEDDLPRPDDPQR